MGAGKATSTLGVAHDDYATLLEHEHINDGQIIKLTLRQSHDLPGKD